ncbi:hypothetical protein BOTBODRAFT_91992, partial [Botryobasidium botryosum FD-172 SS1]
QLLTDSATRWDSTFNMMDRILELYPAIDSFLSKPNNRKELSEYLLSDVEQSVLLDVYQIFEVPHATQQLLSAEKTPTLSLALPAYELLIDHWRNLKGVLPELA